MSKPIIFCTGIFYPEIGGPATYVLKMTQEMDKRGMPYKVITYADKQNNEKSSKIIGIRRSFFLWHYWNYFRSVLKHGQEAEIIYLQGSFSEGIPVILANFFLKKRVVIRVGGIFSWELSYGNGWTKMLVEDFLQKKQHWKSEILKSIDRYVISRCDTIIANSCYMKKLLCLNDIAEGKIIVIYNSIDPLAIISVDSHKYKKELGLEGKKIILFAGRFVPWKNLPRLVEYMRYVESEYHLLMVGDGPQKPAVKKAINQYDLHNKITLIGRITKKGLNKIYQISDVFVLISSFEGLSHILIEAMQFNLPIVSSNIEPNKEVLSDYHNCRFIDFNDRGQFIKSLHELSIQSGNKNSGQECLSKFSFNKIFQDTIKILCK